jgi:tRNA(Ile)-lysidine synthase
MLEAFLTYINSTNLFEKDQKIILAVSGGIDSVVLCELFSKAKLNFAIAHCNFGLRGEESDADEVFVKKLSIKYKVPFFTTTFQTSEYASENNISIQMAARILRYSWFEEIRVKNQFDYLATAHHQNDSIETVLLNLAKGTGLAGFHGIKSKRNQIIRPLLFAKKEMIYDYLVENQLVWREDSSNESIKYQRNFIRQEIVPKFIEINSNFEDTIQRTIQKMTDVENYFNFEFERFKTEQLIKKEGVFYINIQNIVSKPYLKALYFELLGEFNFGYSQCIEIFDSLKGEPGKTFISASHTIVKDRTDLVITTKDLLNEFGTKEIELKDLEDKPLEIGALKLGFKVSELVNGAPLKTNKNTASIDFETLKFPLKVRKWKEGDWFCPLGMNQKKNISDFLNAEKVPLNLKKNILVLTSNGSIVWIVGFRIDNRFKITEKTTKMLFIKKID